MKSTRAFLADKLIESYKDNEDVKMKIMNDKVLDLILENAKIEEISELKTKDKIEEEDDVV